MQNLGCLFGFLLEKLEDLVVKDLDIEVLVLEAPLLPFTDEIPSLDGMNSSKDISEETARHLLNLFPFL